MSAQVAPLFRIQGRVRNIVTREVPAVQAVAPLPADYDDAGNLIRPARPGREGKPAYKVLDVLIDTHRDGFPVPSGMAEVSLLDKYDSDTGGYRPELGDQIDWPVRGYQKWYGPDGRRRSTNGYSFAGDIYAAEQNAASGKRSQAVSAVS